ncbi:hypothetical protein ACTXT7_009446 [Hymenolepis weldensis]
MPSGSSRVQLSAFLAMLPPLFAGSVIFLCFGYLEQNTAFVFGFKEKFPFSVLLTAFTFNTSFDSATHCFLVSSFAIQIAKLRFVRTKSGKVQITAKAAFS